MLLKQHLYRVAKSVVNAMPGWLLRLRPFEVYQLRLSHTNSDSFPDNRSRPIDYRWVETTEELANLNSLAASVNLKQWNGTTCRAVVAWQDSKPVGIAWINSESFEEPDLGLRYELRSNEVWLHSAHVLYELRRQGIYQELLRFIKHELTQEDCKQVLLGVTSGNTSSQNAHSKAGAEKLGSILVIRTLGVSCCLSRGKIVPTGLRLGRQITSSIA